jgi:tetratricopeptide (TPR) repeat protein
MKAFTKTFLFVAVAGCSVVTAQAQDADSLRALRQRVQTLEQRLARAERQARYAARAQQTPEARKMMRRAQVRVAYDRQNYEPEDIAKAEKMYVQASEKLSSKESKALLDRVVSEYPRLNRAGCAQLYRAQQEKGAEKERLLKDCIRRFSDCYYLDGTQVGPYAMFQLANYYQQWGRRAEARRLFDRIYDEYPDAVDHRGDLLINVSEW